MRTYQLRQVEAPEPPAPLRPMGLLGDCDLRWLTAVSLLCLVLMRLVAVH